MQLHCREGVRGALDATTNTYRGEEWHVEVTRLAMVAAGSEAPASWSPILGGGDVRLRPKPTREEVLEAVARACRYPAELLTTADPRPAVALLDARRGKRSLATFGRFGGKGARVRG